MRINTNIVMMIGVFYLLTACQTEKQKNRDSNDIRLETTDNDPVEPEMQIVFADTETKLIFDTYLKLKNELVASNVTGVQKSATALSVALGEDKKDIMQLAEDIAALEDLESQRILFEQASILLEPEFKSLLTSGTIYKQYCPMAFNNNGSFWFSDEEQIANPYFGDKMLRCGSVTEKIEK
ncbi:DUF3347 domain-containing protein [Flavobacteriaceae bacterium M23B6Z8]